MLLLLGMGHLKGRAASRTRSQLKAAHIMTLLHALAMQLEATALEPELSLTCSPEFQEQRGQKAWQLEALGRGERAEDK